MSLPRRFKRNAIANYTGSLVSLVLALLVTPILVRGLGKEAYGAWVLATSMVLYLDLLQFGFGRATVKYVAEANAVGDADRLRRAIATSLFSLSAPGLLILAVAPGLAFLFPAIFDVPDNLVVPAMVVVALSAVDLACAVPSDTFGSTLIGLQRYDLLNVTLMGTAIAQTAAWVVIVALDGGLIAIGAATLTFSLTGQVARYLLARRSLGFEVARPRYFDRGLVRPLLSMSGWIAVTEMAVVLAARMDAVIVGLVAGVPQAGVYAVGDKLAAMVARFTSPAAAQFFPHAAELAASGDREALRRTLFAGTRLGLAIATPLSLVLIVLAGPAIDVWVGNGFHDAALVVAYLSAGTVVATIPRTGLYILRGMGEVKIPSLIIALEAVLNLGLSITLGLMIGLQGVALATLIARVVVHIPLLLPYICRRLQASPLALLFAVLRANALPSIGAVGVGIAFRHAGVSGIPKLMGAGAAMLVVYLVLLVLTGLSGAERRRLGAIVFRRLGSQPAG